MASTLYGTNLIPHFAIGRPTTDGTQISNNFMMSSALKYFKIQQLFQNG
ncbi:hypothetical protein ACVVIH_07615 [Chryseobacterium arthrosphaerae]